MTLPLIFDISALIVLAVLTSASGVVLGLILINRRNPDRNRMPGSHLLYAARRLLRTSLGWACIAVGAVLFPLPIPLGLPLLVIGTLLVGTRTRVIRLATVHLKLLLRRWARLKTPLVGGVGQHLLLVQQRVSIKYRHMRRRYRARRLHRSGALPEPMRSLVTSEIEGVDARYERVENHS